MMPVIRLTRRVKNSTTAKASMPSASMSYLAAYLRYLGILFLGKGKWVAQVPSRASVISPII